MTTLTEQLQDPQIWINSNIWDLMDDTNNSYALQVEVEQVISAQPGVELITANVIFQDEYSFQVEANVKETASQTVETVNMAFKKDTA